MQFSFAAARKLSHIQGVLSTNLCWKFVTRKKHLINSTLFYTMAMLVDVKNATLHCLCKSRFIVWCKEYTILSRAKQGFRLFNAPQIDRIIHAAKRSIENSDAVMGEPLSIHYSGGSSLPDDIAAWLETNNVK